MDLFEFLKPIVLVDSGLEKDSGSFVTSWSIKSSLNFTLPLIKSQLQLFSNGFGEKDKILRSKGSKRLNAILPEKYIAHREVRRV